MIFSVSFDLRGYIWEISKWDFDDNSQNLMRFWVSFDLRRYIWDISKWDFMIILKIWWYFECLSTSEDISEIFQNEILMIILKIWWYFQCLSTSEDISEISQNEMCHDNLQNLMIFSVSFDLRRYILHFWKLDFNVNLQNVMNIFSGFRPQKIYLSYLKMIFRVRVNIKKKLITNLILTFKHV